MPNTYTQLYIHIIFAVKSRQPLISKQHKAELEQYITGIIRNKGQKLIQINAMPNHIHILIGMTPDIAVSDLVRDIKANSSRFINKKGWLRGRFEWQTGFGAFTHSHSHLDTVANYIKNQEKHHARFTFREEYLRFLKRFNIPYDERYVFEDDTTSAS